MCVFTLAGKKDNLQILWSSIQNPIPPPLVGGGRGEGVLGGSLYNLDDRIRVAHGRQNYAVKSL